MHGAPDKRFSDTIQPRCLDVVPRKSDRGTGRVTAGLRNSEIHTFPTCARLRHPWRKRTRSSPLRKSTESSPSCGFSTSVSPFPAMRETPSFGLFRRGGKEQSVGGTPFFVETYPQEISRRTDRWRQRLRRRCHYPRSDPTRGDTVPLASQSTPALQGNRTHVSSLSLFPLVGSEIPFS